MLDCRRVAVAFVVVLLSLRAAIAQVHPAVPAFNSRPGAAYTLYINFAGFTYPGTWGGSTPGVTPAYSLDSNAASFTSTELANIRNILSRISDKYSPWNVNVTTVDPAVTAGQAADDTQRRNYYDSQPRLMHTVVGGNGAWRPGAGGISNLGTTPFASGGNAGAHTNWVFAGQNPSFVKFIGEAVAHENGHGLILPHQASYAPDNTLIAEYSTGTGNGIGHKAPIMGYPASAERALWMVGTRMGSSGPLVQNDARGIANIPGMNGFIDDGIGHSILTATNLPLDGENIDYTLAKGVIVPVDRVAPNPTGPDNYTADYWSFSTGAGTISITANAGRSTLNPPLADPGVMLDSTLAILDSLGNPIATRATTSFSETLTLTLPAGDYLARVSSAGDPLDLNYFDMGSYFLTGFLIAVPEPSTMALLLLGAALLAGRLPRRRRALRTAD